MVWEDWQRLTCALAIHDEGVPASQGTQANSAAGRSNGFNMAFADLSGDGLLDLVTREYSGFLVWLEQPSDPEEAWKLRPIGTIVPDNLVGFALADIDGDRDLDVMSGAYSRGERGFDGDGILMLGVDILPAELPREASQPSFHTTIPRCQPQS